MSLTLPNVDTHSLNAVIRYTDTYDPNDGQCVELHYQDGILGAWSWWPPHHAKPRHVLKANVGFLSLAVPDGHSGLLVYVEPDDELDVFALIPPDAGHNNDTVLRLRDVVDACQTTALRRFLSNAFSLEPVYRWFWTCPGSQRHHHAYKGGLADHSIEMAEHVQASTALDPSQRDLGIAFALVHDLGKIWLYDDDNQHLRPMGHQFTGLVKLQEPLDQLESEWPDGATILRTLLAGNRWMKGNNKHAPAIGTVVRAFDQLSAERDLLPREGHRHQPWAPALPQESNVVPF